MTLTNRISIDAIRTDDGTQMRSRIDDSVVDEYADLIKAGVTLPPVLCVFNDQHPWLVDGFHRLAAAKLAGEKDIVAICNVGTQRDAILMSVGANATHGLRRTPFDKRKAVSVLLNDDEWNQWSDNEIARRCHVSHTFVANVRKSLTCNVASENPSERSYKTKHGSTATMNTAKIGNNNTPAEPQNAGVAGCELESYDPPEDASPEPSHATSVGVDEGVKEPRNQELPTDKQGNPIANPWVAATFGQSHKLREQVQVIRQVRKDFRGLVESGESIVAHLHYQQLEAALAQAVRTINAAIPHAVLPESVTDEKYRKIGWLTKDQFERLPK